MNDWMIHFSAQRHDNGAEYTRTLFVRAVTRIEAEDIGLRKCKMLGYHNFQVSAERVSQ